MNTLPNTQEFDSRSDDAHDHGGWHPDSAHSLRPGSAAQWLRWLGAFAVAGSAIVFLLQGLNNIDLDMRNWLYLALMGVMGGCGYATQKLMQDPKGARLFFGLAALLVPVQFAQLAGLLHDIVNATGEAVPNLLLLMAGTALLSIPLAYTGMAILARKDKRVLTSTFLLMTGALLIPERDSILGFVTLGGLALGSMWLELKVFRGNSVYTGMEGLGVRLLMAAPLTIAAVRMSMHIDSTAGTAAMVGILGVLLSRLHYGRGWVQLLGAALGIAGWWVYASEAMPAIIQGDFGFCMLVIPAAVWLMDIARLSGSAGRHYRFLASMLWMIAAVSLLAVGGSTTMTLAALALGLVALLWGVFACQRMPTFAGLSISVPSMILLIADSLRNVDVNAWVTLGIGGIVLVFSASIVEKYGRPMLANGQKVWQSMSAWD